MTFLVNLIFCRLYKFDGPIFGGRIYRGEAYIQDLNWVTYLGGVLTGFCGILKTSVAVLVKQKTFFIIL